MKEKDLKFDVIEASQTLGGTRKDVSKWSPLFFISSCLFFSFSDEFPETLND